MHVKILRNSPLIQVNVQDWSLTHDYVVHTMFTAYLKMRVEKKLLIGCILFQVSLWQVSLEVTERYFQLAPYKYLF